MDYNFTADPIVTELDSTKLIQSNEDYQGTITEENQDLMMPLIQKHKKTSDDLLLNFEETNDFTQLPDFLKTSITQGHNNFFNAKMPYSELITPE